MASGYGACSPESCPPTRATLDDQVLPEVPVEEEGLPIAELIETAEVPLSGRARGSRDFGDDGDIQLMPDELFDMQDAARPSGCPDPRIDAAASTRFLGTPPLPDSQESLPVTPRSHLPLTDDTELADSPDGPPKRRRVRIKGDQIRFGWPASSSTVQVAESSTAESSSSGRNSVNDVGKSGKNAYMRYIREHFSAELKRCCTRAAERTTVLSRIWHQGSAELRSLWVEYARADSPPPPTEAMLRLGQNFAWEADRVDEFPESAPAGPPGGAASVVGSARASSSCGRRRLSGPPRTVSQAGPASDEEADDERKQMQSKGFMLTFNGRWLSDEPRCVQAIHAKLPLRARELLFREIPAVRKLWEDFTKWWKSANQKASWPKWAIKMELSLHAEVPHETIVHFHVGCFNPHVRQAIRLQQLRSRYTFDGQIPHISACGGRGLRAERALYHLNYYCQVIKDGTLFADTNWPAMEADNPVEQAYIFGLWKARKMDSEKAIAEIERARGCRRVAFCKEIDWNIKEEARKWEEREKWFLQQRLATNLPVVLPEVASWVASFSQKFGRECRFKFLVLVGPSQVGKTRYATKLFGADKTFTVSCPYGIREPNLKGFERRKHRCIVYDEGSSALVLKNRALFQSGLDEQMLSQSTCQEHCYTVWLYGVAQVITTNRWPEEGTSEEDEAWLDANSVVVRREAGEFLFHQGGLPMLRDA